VAAKGAHDRIPSLDGLRGLAAVVVMVHHTMLIDPNLAEAHRTQVVGFLPRLLTYTPLHLVWAGAEAVVVFFVLSGFVLARPYLYGGQRLRIRRFLPRRMSRLYLPVWAALGGVVVLRQVRAGAVVGGSWWLNLHQGPLSPLGLVLDASLLRAPQFTTMPALWSLRWEVAFSLSLPCLVWALRRFGRRMQLGSALLSLAAATLAGHEGPAICAAAVLGVLLCAHEEALREALDRLSFPAGVLLVGGSLLAIVSPWALEPLGWLRPTLRAAVDALGSMLTVIGAVLLVVLALWPPLAQRLSTGLLLWLGERSFSLYLVHEPVGVAVAFALGARSVTLPLVLLSWGLSLLATAAFFRWVELPTAAWSRRRAKQPPGDARTRPRAVPRRA
jgi:peptidoglycan/LPS O-acetylase OafA/YrhL